MPHPSERARRPIAAAVTALAALVVALAPASAATVTVRMDNGYDFDPSTRSIARGDTVRWRNFAAVEDHDVRATAPNGYFKSPGGEGGLEPGESYSRTFKSAGSFPYVCLNHSADGMAGTIVVPMGATRVDGGDRFRLTVASATLSPSSKFRHVIWVDPPGSGSWTVFKTTRKAVVYYTPALHGTYKFRSEVKRLSDGATSDFSPVKSLIAP